MKKMIHIQAAIVLTAGTVFMASACSLQTRKETTNSAVTAVETDAKEDMGVETDTDAKKEIYNAYIEQLGKKKYRNEDEDFEGCHFAVFDLNSDGIPELVIREESSILSDTEYFTYESGEVVELAGPKEADEYPADGGLCPSVNRGGYAYIRGGAMENYWYVIYEYKIKDHKIVLDCVWNGEWNDTWFGKKSVRFDKNGDLCDEEEFMETYEAYEKESAAFVPNTEKNRQKILMM